MKIVVVCGPTAAGKTALAVDLCERLGAEVVSADSQQCYRGLDAGTAKPDAQERARAPHHLLDVAWPEEQLDAAAFVRLADAAIADVASRGKRVLVVGGTGLWIRALVHGLLDAPGANADFRAQFRDELAREGLGKLYARLEQIDPQHGVRPNDRVRIERALEVHAQTGITLSELQRRHSFAERRYEARVVLLDPPRPLLWGRIETRTHALVSGPLLAEARWLQERITRVPEAAKALKIIGYGEAAEALARGATPEALQRCEQTLAARTRQYAKRQRTWFAKDAPRLDSTGMPLQATSGLAEALEQWYERPR